MNVHTLFKGFLLTSLHCSQRSFVRKTEMAFPKGVLLTCVLVLLFFFLCFKARVSIKRLEEFLDLEELDPDSVQRKSRKNEEIGNL